MESLALRCISKQWDKIRVKIFMTAKVAKKFMGHLETGHKEEPQNILHIILLPQNECVLIVSN